MSINVDSEQPIYLEAAVKTQAAEETFTNSVMDKAGVTASTMTSNTTAKYTSDDVKKLIRDEFNKQAITLYAKDLKIENDNDLKTVLKTFTNYENIDSLVDSCKSNEEINKVIEKLIKDIKTALNTGWSLKGITKQQKSAGKKGLSERLAGFSAEIRDKGFENVSADEQKRAIKAFFKTYFEELRAKGKSHDQIVKLQMQTFGRILINSTPEEKRAFKEVIKNLLSENISKGFRETLESIDSMDDKQYLAEGIASDIQEIADTPDEFGNRISPEDLEDITVAATQYSGSEAIERNHKNNEAAVDKFLEENKEKLAEIKNKIDNNEKLTDEEEVLLLELKRKEAIASGEMVGTADNRIIDDRDEIVRLLKVMNEDNWAHNEQYDGFYREVLDSVHEYITNNPDNVNLSERDFTKLMDESTDGNYTRVINNECELAAPGTAATQTCTGNGNQTSEANTTFTYTAQNTQNIGFAQTKTEEEAALLRKKINNLQLATVKDCNDADFVKAYFEENSKRTAIIGGFSIGDTSTKLFNKAYSFFRSMLNSQQVDIAAVGGYSSEVTNKITEDMNLAKLQELKQDAIGYAYEKRIEEEIEDEKERIKNTNLAQNLG